jgi:chromosome segregation ATPase
MYDDLKKSYHLVVSSMEAPVEREDSEEQLRTYRSKAEQEFKDLKSQLNKQLTGTQSENTELRHTIERLSQQHRLAAEEKDDQIQTLEASNALLDDRLKTLSAQHDAFNAKDVEATAAIKSKDDHLKYLEDSLAAKEAEYNGK